MTELLSVTVTFELPGWFPPARLNYERVKRYESWHKYAGQVEYSKTENEAVDMLYEKFPNISELCLHPFGPWVSVEIDVDRFGLYFHTEVRRLQQELDNFLAGFAEAKEVGTNENTRS